LSFFFWPLLCLSIDFWLPLYFVCLSTFDYPFILFVYRLLITSLFCLSIDFWLPLYFVCLSTFDYLFILFVYRLLITPLFCLSIDFLLPLYFVCLSTFYYPFIWFVYRLLITPLWYHQTFLLLLLYRRVCFVTFLNHGALHLGTHPHVFYTYNTTKEYRYMRCHISHVE
jgi:hypothetical protein